MRTKTLLLTAALTVAAAATSMAQAVYSVNVVGYVNLTMRPGYNLVANQLVTGSPANGLNAVLPAVPEESQVLKFVGGNYTSDIFLGGAWLNSTTGDPSATKVNPGDGFFFLNPAGGNVTVTLVGEVQTGASTVTMTPGYSLISSVVPQELSLLPVNGFNPVEEMQYLTFNSAVQNYDTALINLGGQWLNSITGDPADARPVVGQGFFILHPGASNALWNRTFNP
jgi:hypothetical protein